jgi:hypothetical protein
MSTVGMLTVGNCVSFTVIRNMHESRLLSRLVAVVVTVFGPNGKKEPDAGLDETCPQLPEYVVAG